MTAHDEQRNGQSPGTVLDPTWESILRAGQEADGGAGSVDAELGVVHLLRHARRPEALGDEGLASVWGELESELDRERPVPWWRRGWVIFAGTLTTAAAAAAILVVVWPGPHEGGAVGDPLVARAESPAAALERQFGLLAPGARAELGRTVDASRTTLRGELLGPIAAESGKTIGGAP